MEARETKRLAEILKEKCGRKTFLDNLKEYFRENGEFDFVALMRDNEILFREYHYMIIKAGCRKADETVVLISK